MPTDDHRDRKNDDSGQGQLGEHRYTDREIERIGAEWLVHVEATEKLHLSIDGECEDAEDANDIIRTAAFMRQARLHALKLAEIQLASQIAEKVSVDSPKPPSTIWFSIFLSPANAEEVIFNFEETYISWCARHGHKKARRLAMWQMPWLILGHWYDAVLSKLERIAKLRGVSF